MKSTTTRPHLALVPADTRIEEMTQAATAAVESAGQAFALAVAAVTRTPAPIPADVLDTLAELDAEHATALDVFDLAAADIEAARKDLTEAARRLADAEEKFAKAGIVVDETNRATVAAREAAGLVLTASGYRKETK